MAFQDSPPPRRQTDVLQRSRHTAPLDPSALASARPDTPLRSAELAQAIAEVEPFLRSMQPRIKAVERALAACPDSGQTLDEVFAGVSAGERRFTLQMTQVLAGRPDVTRKARIAVQQYRVAAQSFQEAQEVQAQFLAAGLAIGRVEGFSLFKFRGAIHPLYNFCRAFHGVPHFEPLFPPLDGPATTRPLAAAATPEAPANPAPLERLSQLLKEHPRLAPVEPVLQQGLDLLQKVQASAPGLLATVMTRIKDRRPLDGRSKAVVEAFAAEDQPESDPDQPTRPGDSG
ncbi:hypothetical protein D3C86_777100 [compost metagenome]